MDWNKFWAPMRQEMKKEQIIPVIISALGIFPCVYFAKEIGSFWACVGLLLIWFIVVYFLYLIYLYNKN